MRMSVDACGSDKNRHSSRRIIIARVSVAVVVIGIRIATYDVESSSNYGKRLSGTNNKMSSVHDNLLKRVKLQVNFNTYSVRLKVQTLRNTAQDSDNHTVHTCIPQGDIFFVLQRPSPSVFPGFKP